MVDPVGMRFEFKQPVTVAQNLAENVPFLDDFHFDQDGGPVWGNTKNIREVVLEWLLATNQIDPEGLAKIPGQQGLDDGFIRKSHGIVESVDSLRVKKLGGSSRQWPGRPPAPISEEFGPSSDPTLRLFLASKTACKLS